tara:strand:- start:1587 stop:2564 length:978 start_codon:yes stop_codon:yes gene_type:complete
MINKTYSEMLEKIITEAKIEQKELEDKVETKVKELDGLVSKEGALHIIANELKVKLFDHTTRTHIQIKDLVPGMIKATVVGRILAKYDRRDFERNGNKGSVISCLIGDETGRTRVTFWDTTQIEQIEKEAKEGELLLVKGVRVRENRGYTEAHAESQANIKFNPKGYEIKDIPVAEQQTVDYKQINIDKLDGSGQFQVTGTIVQMFEPRSFMACAECSKKVGEDGKCAMHANADAQERFIINFILDDGTSSVRCSQFCTEKDGMFDVTKDFELTKKEYLLSTLSIKGRGSINDMNNRPEMIINAYEKPEINALIKKTLEAMPNAV